MNDSEVDISRFNSGMEGLVRALKVEPPVVIRHEAGQTIKTLVRVTPPKDPGATRQRIAKNVRSKFQVASELQTTTADYGGKHGKGEVSWYAWNPQFLFGALKSMDLRKADTEKLRKLLYTLTKRGKQRADFVHSRKRQKILISQNILTTESQMKKLVARIQGHVGRLKAGWLVSWASGKIQITGSNLPPGYVTKHAPKARGYFIDGLGVESFPTFSIANTAVGIGRNNCKYLVNTALSIRAKAMRENTQVIFAGKRTLADYTKGRVLTFKDN